MITESQIKAAVRAAITGKPRTELHDRGARGAGRLVLTVRRNGDAPPMAEFYACWYRSGKRVMSKLGSHPAISLADARKRFREEFARPDYQRRRGAHQRGRQAATSEGSRHRRRAVRGLRRQPAGGWQAIGSQG
jgi:hypothetical protein